MQEFQALLPRLEGLSHFDFITVDHVVNSGFFECRIKQRGCCFQRMSVGARIESTEDQNLSRREFF